MKTITRRKGKKREWQLQFRVYASKITGESHKAEENRYDYDKYNDT